MVYGEISKEVVRLHGSTLSTTLRPDFPPSQLSPTQPEYDAKAPRPSLKRDNMRVLDMGYRGPSRTLGERGGLESLCGGIPLNVPMDFLYTSDWVEHNAIIKWEPVSGHGYPGIGAYFRGVRVDRENILSHQRRIPDEELRRCLWTRDTMKAAAKQFDEGLRKIQSTAYNTKKARKEAYKRLCRECLGSRGSTPAHDMITDSILQFCVDGLHFKNNCGLLTCTIMMQEWVSFGVYEDIKKRAGKSLAVLFTENMKSTKANVYSVEGGVWSKFILEMPRLLRPILDKARKTNSLTLLQLYVHAVVMMSQCTGARYVCLVFCASV